MSDKSFTMTALQALSVSHSIQHIYHPYIDGEFTSFRLLTDTKGYIYNKIEPTYLKDKKLYKIIFLMNFFQKNIGFINVK